jgi:hypothetical protein
MAAAIHSAHRRSFQGERWPLLVKVEEMLLMKKPPYTR